MNEQDKDIANYIAELLAAKLGGGGCNTALANGMGGQVTACDGTVLDAPCANLLFSPFTIEDFLRSGQTEIDQVESGVIPVVPGASTVITQASHPGWAAGCINISYRLANNATNHQDIRFDFFVDGTALDRPLYGSNIYDNNNTMIGDGWHPLPLQGRKQCCIGAMNKLRVRITHQGVANQLEQPRIIVSHGKRECCSACSVGKPCQSGCSGAKPYKLNGQLGIQVNFNGGINGNGNGNGGGQLPGPIPNQAPPGHVLAQVNGQWVAVPMKALQA